METSENLKEPDCGRVLILVDDDCYNRLRDMVHANTDEGDVLRQAVDFAALSDTVVDETLSDWVVFGRAVRATYNNRRRDIGNILIDTCPFKPGMLCRLTPKGNAEKKKVSCTDCIVRVNCVCLVPSCEAVVVNYSHPRVGKYNRDDVVFYGSINLPDARIRLKPLNESEF